MNKIALLSHCVLNSLCELPQASDTFRKSITDTLIEKKMNIVQLPCPELCYQALNRVSIEPEDPSAEEYRLYCRELLKPLIHNFEEYKSREIELALILGIDTSPSCSVLNKKAIMTEILIEQLEALNIVIKNKIDMPISGDGKAFLEVLQSVE